MSVPVENGYTPRWTAPEIFRGTAIPNKETDVFSFAMVAIEVGRRSIAWRLASLPVNSGFLWGGSVP